MEFVTIKSRKRQLKLIMSAKKKTFRNEAPGYLKATRSHGTEQFHHIVEENGVMVDHYIAKDNTELLHKLAQKSYDHKIYNLAEQELKAWDMLAKFFPDITIEELYETLSPIRQKYVVPIQPTDEEYRKQWEAVKGPEGKFDENAPVYLTMRGERVRSKSEMLIANLLYQLGIPYRYEYPLTIEVDGRMKTWRPDFTILDVKNRKEYYLEHFGMMDDTRYARSAYWKMKIYEKNGLYEGKNIILSQETSTVPLDMDYLEMRLRRIFGIGEPIIGD